MDFTNAAGDFARRDANNGKAGVGSPVFFNTGKLVPNPEFADLPPGVSAPDLKYNDFVVYDSAQVRLRFAVLCQFHSN